MEMWQISTLKIHLNTLSDRQIDVFFSEIGVTESNGDDRILTGSSEVAICAHAQYKFGRKRLERRRAAFMLQCFTILTFSSLLSNVQCSVLQTNTEISK